MPNLISQANRLNDVEINNNKPVTSGVFRRIGSSINFLLDLVGANDGDTSSGGGLGDILQAEQTLSFTLSYSNPTSGTSFTLFNFQGSATRPIMWYKKSSGFSEPISKQIGVIGFNGLGAFGFNGPAISIINDTVAANPPSAGNWDLRVNGVTIAEYRPSATNIFNPVRDITIAPAGTNTLALVYVGGSSAGTKTVSRTYYAKFV